MIQNIFIHNRNTLDKFYWYRYYLTNYEEEKTTVRILKLFNSRTITLKMSLAESRGVSSSV